MKILRNLNIVYTCLFADFQSIFFLFLVGIVQNCKSNAWHTHDMQEIFMFLRNTHLKLP